MGRYYAKQRNLGQPLVELTLIDYSMRDTCHHILRAVSGFRGDSWMDLRRSNPQLSWGLSFVLCGQSSDGERALEPTRCWRSDRDPTPRGVGFRLSQMSLSPSVRTRVGSGKAGSLSVDWCSWENIRRGIHGSTSEHRDGLCAVVPVSHEYPGATASDLGSVGECANCRSLSEHWCQDGKCATRTKARVAWNVVLYCSNRASICSLALILLSPSRVFVMTGWRTSISLQPFVQTRLDYGSLLYTSISFHPVFQNPCVSNTFEL